MQSDLLDGGVLEYGGFGEVMEDGRFTDSTIIFNLPCVTLSVVDELGRVIALVKILEDCGQNLWRFVGQINSTGT